MFKKVVFKISKFIPSIPAEYKRDYSTHKFHHNNLRVLILAGFLFFEQLIYAVYLSEEASVLQRIYYVSAIAMLVLFFWAYKYRRRAPQVPGGSAKLFELSLCIAGMLVALLRVLLLESEVFRLPTIYIAVLYGIAVIFFIPYLQSFVLYGSISFLAILLLPHFQAEIQSSRYIADIASNGLIAWLISSINYRNFVTDFLNKKIIKAKNEELMKKNRQIRRANKNLKEQTIRDGLTELYNRRRLDTVLQEEWTKAERYGSYFTVIMMDIDFFKQINDNYGHDVGDMVLKDLAGILMENIREVDTCGRWGGEEFLIICPETDLEHAERLAERLRKVIGEYEFPQIPQLTASFGLCSYEEGQKLRDIIKFADTRLYEAKSTGRNKVVSGLQTINKSN